MTTQRPLVVKQLPEQLKLGQIQVFLHEIAPPLQANPFKESGACLVWGSQEENEHALENTSLAPARTIRFNWYFQPHQYRRDHLQQMVDSSTF